MVVLKSSIVRLETTDTFHATGFTVQMLYEDPVKDIDIEKQTLTTNSGKLLKYGSLIIATGCTASRYEAFTLVHLILFL